LEIACDESGYEGDKLIGTSTDVFAHASVRLDGGAAADCMQELRDRIRSPATEYKAGHLLREKHRAVLVWMLGPAGPVDRDTAHVFLVNKAYFVVGTVVDVLGAGPPTAAATLYRQGRRAFGTEEWQSFLAAANDLLRVRNGLDSVGTFTRALDGLRGAGGGDRVDEILELLWQARSRAEAVRADLLDHPGPLPVLDPLIPAIVRAVVHWGGSVCIAHDRQNMLSTERIAQLIDLTGTPDGRLAGLRLVDSREDPRVQVADVLAGAVRKIASDELNDRGDPELTALLHPYLDAFSIWGDDPSWARLTRGAAG